MMDAHVERQCKETLSTGNFSQFFILFDAYFEDLYKYVSRRIFDVQEVERIVNATFLDVFSNYSQVPFDLTFDVWLFAIARERVWSVLNQSYDSLSRISDFCEYEEGSNEEILIQNLENMFAKLSLEEGEIMRLKFFEEMSDSDVMFILNANPETIGARIYKVLKRAHFLLFGETDEVKGVYFGELSGLISRVKEMQSFDIPDAFKINLKASLSSRISENDFALSQGSSDVLTSQNVELENKNLAEDKSARAKGSDDPAKIFVNAANELSEEERQVKYDEWRKKKEIEQKLKEKKEDKRDDLIEIFDTIKIWLIRVPVFILLIAFIVWGIRFLSPRITIFDSCRNVAVNLDDFTEDEQDSLNASFVKDLCKIYDPSFVVVTKVNSDRVQVELDSESWLINYDFDTRNTIDTWYVQKFKRTSYSNGESGEV